MKYGTTAKCLNITVLPLQGAGGFCSTKRRKMIYRTIAKYYGINALPLQGAGGFLS